MGQSRKCLTVVILRSGLIPRYAERINGPRNPLPGQPRQREPTALATKAHYGSTYLLESYHRHRVKYISYPTIVPCTGSSVRGSVVTGLTEGDIYRLDIFAGDQYERKKVKVKVLKDVGQNGAVEAHATEEVEVETCVWKRRPNRT